MKKIIFLLIILSTGFLYSNTLDEIKNRGYFTWGADAGGGAPYIFPNPENPNELIGFEVDIANEIAKRWGVEQKHIQTIWDSLVPALNRGDFDIAMNGIEITPERLNSVLFSLPYYIYTEQLVVRKNENNIKTLDDVYGKKVGTLSGTVAQIILEEMKGVIVKIYPTQIEPYQDLEIGRIDAVLLDSPIAGFYAKPNPNLKYVGEPVGEGLYGIAIRQKDLELKIEIDNILTEIYNNGRLQEIYEKWDMWNHTQEKFFKDDLLLNKKHKAKTSIFKFFPMLLKGASITITISTISMFIAIILGLFLTLVRLYGNRFLRILATGYVEIYRGTPLLIQIYILYYGLPNIGITLNPIVAALLGLGMNYAAYESEIYRAGIMSIPKGQMEASLSLGMTRTMAIKRIILPQALPLTLPPMTNDFIALFKDSSLVSIIAIVELTKTYSMLATSTLRFLEFGLIVAFLYFAMSYPLSLFAKRLEFKMRGGKK